MLHLGMSQNLASHFARATENSHVDWTEVIKLFIRHDPVIWSKTDHRMELLRGTADRACREDGTLADMLSKDDMNAFSRALAERGLPPPAVAPFIRVKARM
jgi:hypothetical protein